MMNQQPKKPLSGWTNLQDVFAANKGNGAQMNDAVYKPLEQAGQTALDRLGTAKSGFRAAAEKAGDRTRWNADGSMNYQMAAGPTYSTAANTSNDPYRINSKSPYERADAEDQLSADQSASKAQAAQKGYEQAQAATAQAVTKSTDTYKGPRTLKEYDPGIGAAIGDAASRINASAGAQFQNTFQGASAGGGALDQALMGAEGGDQRRGALQSKFGTIMKQLQDEQQAAQAYGTQQADARDADALSWAQKLPELQDNETRLSKRAAEEAAIAAKNNKARSDYDTAWRKENQKFNKKRGNQIQRSYQPPESDQVPFYPAS